MASVTKEVRNGRTLYRIEYRDQDKRRKKLRLGSVAKRDAQAIAAKVQSIISAKVAGNDPPTATAEWLATIGDDLHQRLAEQELCKPRAHRTLGGWVADYLDQHERTIGDYAAKSLGRSRDLLFEFLGKDTLLRAITPERAQAFRVWLADKKGMAQATIAKHIKHAKQFFLAAVDADALTKSPFAKVTAGTQANAERSVYVSTDDIEKAIAMAPDAQWRLLIALSRYAGLRSPSETLRLRWADVDFVRGTLTVHMTKTAKQGKTKRVVPILPELRPHLEDAFDPEADRCISRYQTSNLNLRKVFLEILAKAGLKPWPRLFHNLRGSLQTDLADRYPLQCVVEWLGNSEKVAAAHYLKTTTNHLANAQAAGVGQGVGTSLAESTALSGNDRKKKSDFPEENAKPLISKGIRVGRAGLEPTRENKGETLGVGQGVGTSTAKGGAKADRTGCPMLATLEALWPSLRPADRQDLLGQAQAAVDAQAGAYGGVIIK
jgi:integrase